MNNDGDHGGSDYQGRDGGEGGERREEEESTMREEEKRKRRKIANSNKWKGIKK